jgi:CelD/BcsL family acetyltransferase involved in cellulose biosynthesis
MDARAAQLAVSLVADPAKFLALQADWDELFRNAAAGSAAQRFAYARTGWEQVASPAGELRIIVVRRGATLVGLWPLYVRQEGRVFVARHLGAGADEEYAGPLIRDGEDEAAVASAAFERAKTLADVLRIYNLRRPSPVTRMIEADPAPQDRQLLWSPIVNLGGVADFEAWLRKKSRNFRHALRNRRRRLAALGEVRFAALTPGDDVPGFVDWLLRWKLALVDGRGVAESWVRRPQSRAFYEAILRQPSEETGVAAFIVTLDGKTISGGVCLIAGVMEYCITGYDAAYAVYSPGSQLVEGLVGTAIQRGVDFDFRLTQDDHKRRWMDREEERATYVLATTPRGVPTVIAAKLRRRLISVRTRLGALRRRIGLGRPSA